MKYDIVSTGEERTVTMVETLLLDIIPVIVLFIVAVISLANYSFLVAVFSTIACCLIFISETFFNKKMLPLFRKGRDMWLQQNKVSIEAFSHLSTVKSFAVESKFIKQFLSRREAAMIWNLEVDKTSEIYYGKRNYLIAFFNFIGLCVSVYLLIKGYVLVGAIFTIFSVNNNIFWQARNLQNYIRKIVSSYIDVQKYLDIIDKQPEFDENGKSKFVDGDITFENLTFKYPKGDSNVIENLSINIPQGKKVAFVGHSGSGKTTITRLLLRAYNYKDGSIKISGTELKDIDASSLRHAIGYVEQHVDLFDDTIKNNILFGVDEKEIKKWEKAKIVDAKLEEIAKLARIDEFYHRLGETKFETEIGERGIKLSGGEKQRVAIARALLKNPPILVFDEATSALDSKTEKAIQASMDIAARGRTTLIIAHRLSTVMNADEIIVMDAGRIIERGRHAALLEAHGVYAQMWALQQQDRETV